MSNPESTTRRRLSRAETLILIGLVMIAVQTAFRIWSVSGSWFLQDDFQFISAETSGRVDLNYLFSAHNVHVMPLSYLLVKPVAAAGTYVWWMAALEIVVMQLFASLACWWMLRTLFGDRPGTLVALSLYLFSPMVVPGTLWWAAAINMLPQHIALFAFIATHTRYMQTRQRRWLGWATLFLIIGFASYPKTVLAPMVATLLAVLYFSDGQLIRRVRTALVDFSPAWRLYFITTVAYLAHYFAVTEPTLRPSLSTAARTLELAVVQALGPSLLGGPWQWSDVDTLAPADARTYAATSLGLVVIAWIVIAAGALWYHLRVRRGLWSLWIITPYVLLSGVIITTGRATSFGVEMAGLEVRYMADVAGIAALCLGLTIMPVRGAKTTIEPRPMTYSALPASRSLGAVVAVLFVAGGFISAIRYVAPWHDEATMIQRAYMGAVEGSIDELEEPVEIIDTFVPDEVLWSAAFPFNLSSAVLSAYEEHFTVVEEGTNLHLFDQSGTLRRAQPVQDPRTEPGPSDWCGYAVSDGRTDIEFEPIRNYGVWVFINYVAAEPGSMRVRAGDDVTTTPVYAGANTFIMRQTSELDRVTFWPDLGTALCVDSIHIADLDETPVQGNGPVTDEFPVTMGPVTPR